MGQKVHPTGARVGIIRDWNSKWYANSNNFADYLVEDQKIRKFLKKKLYLAGISKIEIERTAKAIKVNLYTAKPGIVIGKGGAGVETVKAELTKVIGKDVNLNIVEVKNIDIDAQLVAENIAGQLERRISFRKAMKQCMQKSMKSGALGIKTAVSGTPATSNIILFGFTADTQNSVFPLPLPIRVPAGFLVIGLSGKILIQTLPSLFI